MSRKLNVQFGAQPFTIQASPGKIWVGNAPISIITNAAGVTHNSLLLVTGSGFGTKLGSAPTGVDFGQDAAGNVNNMWAGAWPDHCSDPNYNLVNRNTPFSDAGFTGGGSSLIQAPTPFTPRILAGNHHDKTGGNTGLQVIPYVQYTTPAFPFYEVWDWRYRHDPKWYFDLGSSPQTDTHDNNTKFHQLSVGTGGPASAATQNGYNAYWGSTSGTGPLSNTDTGISLNPNSGPGFLPSSPGWLASPDNDGLTHFQWATNGGSLNFANGNTTFGNESPGWVHCHMLMAWTDQTNGFWYWYQNGSLKFNYNGPLGFQSPVNSIQSFGLGGYARNQSTMPSTGVAGAGIPGTFTQWRYFGHILYDRQLSGLNRFYLTNSPTFSGPGGGIPYELQNYTSWTPTSVVLKINKGTLSSGNATLWFMDEINGVTTPAFIRNLILT